MYVGWYSAASGMIAQGINQDVIAQNLANASVGGFKKERMVFRSFPDILLSAAAPSAVSGSDPMRAMNHVGRVGTGTGLDWIYTVYDNGAMRYTQEPTDLALLGDGFFTLQLQDTGGTAYTRNGAFMHDSDGYLRTMEGDYLMGAKGRVRINAPDFVVDHEGNLAASDNPTAILDTLDIVDFNNRDLLRPLGGSKFVLEAADPATAFKPPQQLSVAQGYLEGSNANPVTEMVTLLDSFRNFEANSRVARAFDDSAARTIDLVLRR